MKKTTLLIFTLLTSPLHAAQLYLGNSGSNLNTILPGIGTNGGRYYKCTNSVTFSCQSDGLLINYTSQSGNAGTSRDPYILSGCSFVSCACGAGAYLTNNNKTCVTCPYNAYATQNSSDFHTNTQCNYCPKELIKTSSSPTKCEACPSNATCNGSTTFICNYRYYKNGNGCTACPDSTHGLGTLVSSNKGATADTYDSGATSITECYIDGLSSYSETLFYDSTGKFYLTDECYYKN